VLNKEVRYLGIPTIAVMSFSSHLVAVKKEGKCIHQSKERA